MAWLARRQLCGCLRAWRKRQRSRPGPRHQPQRLDHQALTSEIERVKADKDFMAMLRALTKRDKEILDRLAR